MKVTPDTLSDPYHATEAWGDTTLDMLFRQTAQLHPTRMALVDAPDRSNWTGGDSRSLTYQEAEREIDRLAAFYRAIGLTTDHVIGVQSPNTVDTVIAILAALRAGLIVSTLPLHWRQKNVLEALNSVGAKGFIAADRIETRNVGAAARDVAADLFSLRFVFGLGKDIPDGLIELGPMLAEMGDDLTFDESERDKAADHVATISWTRSGSETVPVPRCHNHWIASARQCVHEAGLNHGERILVPYSLSGLTGIGAGLVPWLLVGGTLHLHHPTSLLQLSRHANAIGADYVLTPGPLTQILDKKLVQETTTIVSAWNVAAPKPGTFMPHHKVVDLHIADEFALVAKARGPSAKVQATPLGKQAGPNGCESGPALLEIAVDQGENGAQALLQVKGPMVPDVGWHTHAGSHAHQRDQKGFLSTGIPVEQSEDGLKGFGIPGAQANGVGDLEALDELYSAYPGVSEAAAFLVEDELLGARLYAALVPVSGNVPDAKAFFAYLDADGVDLAKIPYRVLVLQALPRNNDGTIDRERLTLRTQRLPAAVA
ncbi:class I adenylate-forming enzyme family protein [uncultured Roseibium sp.]|uniref:class I adenylate-forming enzyme family protein n=1 Tax=uncultured Roseibium sp. TaxID=1936171 RepID=UPI003216CA4B